MCGVNESQPVEPIKLVDPITYAQLAAKISEMSPEEQEQYVAFSEIDDKDKLKINLACLFHKVTAEDVMDKGASLLKLGHWYLG